MLLELFLASALGIIFGVLVGLTPGIHTNLIGAFLVSLSSSYFMDIKPIILASFIVSISITSIIIDFIPSIFLGAPDEDSALSILPGHEMLIQGKGYSALLTSNLGCITGVILTFILAPFFILFLAKIYPYFKKIIFIILFLIIFSMIYSEKNIKFAIIITILAGFLGISSINLGIKQPLLPLLTGLFGSSSLIMSISRKQKIPPQSICSLKEVLINLKKKTLKPIVASLIASPLCSFLPGLGSSQAAAIGSYSFKEFEKQEFLFLIGTINMLVMGLSFITLYCIGKSRTGSAAAIQNIIPSFGIKELVVILFIMFASSFFAFFTSIFIAKKIIKNISKVSYSKLSLFVLVFLCIIIISISSFWGFLLFLTSTILGILCINLNIKRTILMSSLIIPTLIYSLS
ncbi:MAG: tripartite tricarboxylate transporter permease [Candidatus Nanoarchaeia archaeon]